MTDSLHSVLDVLDEPVLLLASDRIILHANNAAQKLFGVDSNATLIGSSFVRVLRNPEALRCVNAVLSGDQQAQTVFQLDIPHRATMRLSATAMETSSPAVVVTLKDETPLLQAAQMRSDFVANVSHELRSPLTTLSGIIETLQGNAKDDPEAQQRFLKIMQSEAGRMDRLIGDLISLSRVEEEERVRPTESVDLVEIAWAVMSNLKERSEAADREFDFQPETEKCFVVGDSDQLTQVFQNLLENAVKYSKSGGRITLKIESKKSAPRFNSTVWAASVSDEGEGIDAEHLPRLTERFYRIDSGRSRAMGGTGLGLAIVKHILSRHRGRLHIASVPGEGVTMTALIPALL